MENLSNASRLFNDADVVIVVAGNGWAKSEGLDLFDDANFVQTFPQVVDEYKTDTLQAALELQLSSWSAKWLLWSQLIKKYSLEYKPSQAMRELKQLLNKKKYFIASSGFGHFFEAAGFNQNRIFNINGDWTKMQCSSGINHGLVDDREVVAQIYAATNSQEVEQLVPKCPVCGQAMEPHLPLTAHFYPETDANARFRWFLTGNEEEKTVFLELGVDETTPQLREPILHLVQQFPQWSYLAANAEQDMVPLPLQTRSAAVKLDPDTLIHELLRGKQG